MRIHERQTDRRKQKINKIEHRKTKKEFEIL